MFEEIITEEEIKFNDLEKKVFKFGYRSVRNFKKHGKKGF